MRPLGHDSSAETSRILTSDGSCATAVPACEKASPYATAPD